ncbi:MAG: acyl-CoA dehydrogenase family protein [Candidatus Binatia bacterium]|nr:acyl-CoA dehydrogenase family protein [Candidatus Binatia bacterium]
MAPETTSAAEDLDAFRAEVRTWMEQNRPPQPGFVLPQTMLFVTTEEQFTYLRDWQAKVYAAGFVGVEWPSEYGGGGRARGHQRVVDQEMARAGVPFLINLVGLAWAGPVILAYGTEAQKKRFIAKILRADEIWCQGFSEPSAGSDLASLQTRAVRNGDQWNVNGHKVWTSLGRFADQMILLARTDPGAQKHAGISFFLSPMKTDGVEVAPLTKITGEGGFNQIFFADAKFPADRLLGQEGQGWEIALATLNFERGAAEGAAGGGNSSNFDVARTIELARRTQRYGRPATHDPSVRDRLARFAIEAVAIRFDRVRTRIPGLVADRPLALPLMGKVVGSEHAQRLADFGCELQGYAGTLTKGDRHAIDEGEWQRAYLNSYGLTIAGGTSEIVRNILGEKVLGLPKTK